MQCNVGRIYNHMWNSSNSTNICTIYSMVMLMDWARALVLARSSVGPFQQLYIMLYIYKINYYDMCVWLGEALRKWGKLESHRGISLRWGFLASIAGELLDSGRFSANFERPSLFETLLRLRCIPDRQIFFSAAKFVSSQTTNNVSSSAAKSKIFKNNLIFLDFLDPISQSFIRINNKWPDWSPSTDLNRDVGREELVQLLNENQLQTVSFFFFVFFFVFLLPYLH